MEVARRPALGLDVRVDELDLLCGQPDDGGNGEFDSLRVDEWEQRLIRESLKRTNNSVPEAAKLLGIGRATLYRKIDEYGIER